MNTPHEHEPHSENSGMSSEKAGAMSRMKNTQMALPLAILAAGVLISASIIFTSGAFKRSDTTQTVPTDTTGGVVGTAPESQARDVVLGDAKAPVAIIEYGDYQCPFCVKFFKETEPLIRENYIKTGKAKMVFRSFQFLGPESLLAAEAAECAKDQKKFWEYHDGLYLLEESDGQENNGNITKQALISLAGAKGLDAGSFGECLNSGKYEKQVKDDTASAQTSGVRSTPTVFVNGQKFEGAYPFATFQQVIDAALKK